MNNKNPAFIDCYGDLGNRFSLEMKSIIPNLDVFYDEPKNEQEIIKRINGRKNIMVYMSFLSSDILNSCSGLKTISYLSTGLQTHGDLKEAEKLEGVKLKNFIPPNNLFSVMNIFRYSSQLFFS